MRGDLAPTIRELAGMYPHIQNAGTPGRHEPDVGEINYPYLFDLLDEIGYEGWIGCEYCPKGDTVAGLGWAKRYGDRLMPPPQPSPAGGGGSALLCNGGSEKLPSPAGGGRVGGGG